VITNPLFYILALALIAVFISVLEKRTRWGFFKYIPTVVLIYATTMLFASLGVWELNEDINNLYKLAKTNLLPAMIFLMLLEVDIRAFFRLGKKLITSYVLAVVSIAIGFIVVSFTLNLNSEMLGAFGALAGSWMGGTANMVAVGSAIGVSDEAFGYALIVDSFNYTLWVALLLFLVGFSNLFDRFTGAKPSAEIVNEIGCSCNMGAKKYWLLVSVSIFVSFFSQIIAQNVSIINQTTTMVIVATVLGIAASFSKLGKLNGSSDIATSILYMLIALIGSRAVFESFSGVGFYVFAGFLILLIHALLMIIGAKIFKLDLFSISVASLSNIGGVASAPILAAAYNKSLVGVGVLMAIMGYIIGTFGGLGVAYIIR
jgi:uncharacterized membrane protein